MGKRGYSYIVAVVVIGAVLAAIRYAYLHELIDGSPQQGVQELKRSAASTVAEKANESKAGSKEKNEALIWEKEISREGQILEPSSVAFATARLQGKVPRGRTVIFNTTDKLAFSSLEERQSISLPLPGGRQVTGKINLVQTGADGVVRVGGSLTDGGAGSFSMAQDARGVNGRVLLREQNLAYLVSTPTVGQIKIEEVALGDVMCFPLPRDEKVGPGREPDAALPGVGPEEIPPALQGKPGASAVLYLDFDGAVVTDPDWNDGNTINAAASTLTSAQITEVWARVKEDFAPFNINVTTVASDYASAAVGSRMRVIITPTDYWYPDAGGVAYRDTFSRAGEYAFTTDVPCWVFNFSVNGIAEAISHELGHTLGLQHDRDSSYAAGSADYEYYSGHGGYGPVSWGPIMGAAYDRTVVQWSKGEYPSATHAEDDVAIIAGLQATPLTSAINATGYVADEAGDSRGAAAALGVSGNTINQSGVINSATDVDFYSFTVPSPQAVTINANPASTYSKEPNLDIVLELQDSSGNVLASANPDGALNATIAKDLEAGTYYIRVTGSGRAGSSNSGDYGYSNYGSLGQYTLTGTLVNLTPTAPVITGQRSAIGSVGGYATLDVSATGYPAPSFQWQRLPAGGTWSDLSDNLVYTGTHAGRLQVLMIASMDGDQYRCLVSNSVGSITSNPVSFSVAQSQRALGWISLNFPSSAATGSQVSGSATVINAGTQTWGANDRLVLYNSGSVEITFASLNGVAPGQTITVPLIFTAPYESISTAYSLQPVGLAPDFISNVRSFAFSTFGADVPPSIVAQPQSRSASVGDDIAFAVVTVGQLPFVYQWRFNGVDIPGATGSSLVLSNVQEADAGVYSVKVTNGLGFVVSADATLAVTPPPGVVSAAASGNYTIFLRADGKRWALGYGGGGQLGDGTINSLIKPKGLDTGVALIDGLAPDQSVFVKLDGTLWAVGALAGRLSGAVTDQQLNPVAVTNGSNVAALSAGFSATYFIRTDGTLWAAGSNTSGQLGDGTLVTKPTPVQVATDVAAVAGGNQHALFLKGDGTVWGMGYGGTGALGSGLANEVQSNTNSTPVILAVNAMDVAAGTNHSAILQSDGSLWSVGLLGNTLTQVASNVKRMAAGGRQLVFVKADGTLWGLGDNHRGELGDGTITDRNSAVQIASDVFEVATGEDHSVFVKNDGSLWGMGDATYWQIGSRSGSMSNVPVQIAGGTVAAPGAPTNVAATQGTLVGMVRLSWSMVAGASGYEIWRNTSDDTVGAAKLATVFHRGLYFDTTAAPATVYYYWIRAINPSGAGAYGGSVTGYNIAPVAPAFTTQPADAIFEYGSFNQTTFTVAATGNPSPRYRWQVRLSGGSVWTDLSNGDARMRGVYTNTLTIDSGLAATSHGNRYRCVATNLGGSVFSAEATLTVNAAVPQITVQPVSFAANIGSGGGFQVSYSNTLVTNIQWQKDGVDIAGASSSILQMTNLQPSDAGIYTVRVSNGSGSATSAGAALEVVPGYGTNSSAGGSRHSVFVRFDHTLWGMGQLGFGENGKVPLDSTWPRRLATNVIQAAAGYDFTVFLKSDGTLWHAGRYFYPYTPPPGGPEIFTPGPITYSTPSAIQVASDVTSVTAGHDHIAFIRADGSLWTMGTNSNGQLGNGNFSSQAAPVQIAQNVSKVSAGRLTTYFIKQDGSLWAVGDNYFGQLGNGSTSTQNQPVQIATGVQAVRGDTSHALYLKNDQTMWGMGTNFNGALGAGVQAPVIVNFSFVGGQQATPVQISSGVSQIMVGGGASFFRKADGTTWAMGYGAGGRLGNGLGNNASDPVQIPAADLEHSSLGDDHVLFVRPNGELWAAGQNYAGQLGDGTTTGHTTQELIASGPLALGTSPAIATQPQVQSISVGANASFTVAATGTASLSYQWRKGGANLADGGNVSGSTSATLTIASAQLADVGSYDVVVSNAFGHVTSNAASLTVYKLGQTITFAPLADKVYTAAPVMLSATSSSSLPVSFTVQSGAATVSGNELTLTGTGSVTVRASQAGNTTYDAAPSVDHSFTVLSAYAGWQQSKFTSGELSDVAISGPNADPDMDGYSNLLEYALGLEPKSADATGLPEMSTSGSDWVYTYTRPSDRSDVTFSVEVSTDLSSWTTTGVTHELVSTSAGVETWRAKYPLGSATNVFLRLKATMP